MPLGEKKLTSVLGLAIRNRSWFICYYLGMLLTQITFVQWEDTCKLQKNNCDLTK